MKIAHARRISLLATIAMLATAPIALACMRESVDRRAVQWSDAVVVATLITIEPRPNQSPERYQFTVVESVDGPLKKSERVEVDHRGAPGQAPACAGHLSSDDVGKLFVVLLRKTSAGWLIVTIGARDGQDPTARDALRQLVAETRKADAAVTVDQASLQARTLANAEDDTEADQAEQALLEMGPRAAPGISIVIPTTSSIGKTRLMKVSADIMPPAWAAVSATTQPAG